MDSTRMNDNKYLILAIVGIAMILFLPGLTTNSQAGPILDRLKTITTVASTVPSNGDLNPYGVARVLQSAGKLKRGHILVSNFNNKDNLQGTGSTIVDIAPDGTVGLFAEIDAGTLPGSCPGGVGLTTALVALRSGWVIVGSLPTTDGTAATAQAGCLIVLDSNGNPVETIAGSLINGPWDMVASEMGNNAILFVTNVLNGTVEGNGEIVNEGTVVRINLTLSRNKKKMPQVQSMTIIGSDFPQKTDPAALVIGPTGVGFSQMRKVLYVADSLNNRIAVIEDAFDRTDSASTGTTFSEEGSLNDPLGLVVTSNGHILTVNGDDGFITELTPQGKQVATVLLDNTPPPPPATVPLGAGALFGLAFDPSAGVYFVDNVTNTLNLLGKH